MIVCVPSLPRLGVYVTEQLPDARVQKVALNVPVPLLLKLTVPVGVIFEPEEESETVAVQVEGALTASLAGLQLRLVLVDRIVAVRLKVLELVGWSVSPP